MIMYSKYFYAFAALTLGLTACSNEDLTSPEESPVAGKTVHVTLTVNRPSDNTRTIVDENLDGLSLYSKWTKGDQILVVNSDKKEVGKLTIDEGSIGKSEGVFSGVATLANTEKYTLVYLGGKNGEAGAYASWTDGTGISNPVATPDSENGFAVSGDKADLCRADLMQKEGVQFLVSGDNAYPTDNVSLDAVNAMAHFTLTGLPEPLVDDAVLTVNYGDVKHTITNIQSELYLPMPTGTFAISFNLSNGDASYTASINEGNDVTVAKGLYYVDTDDSGLNGKGIEVALEKVVAPEPADDDLVGPVIPINGKKYRFVKGNLYYDINDNSWHLYEKETYYRLLAGTSGIASGKSINGKSINKETNHIIDMFPWGATGLGDNTSTGRAKTPDVIRQGWGGEKSYASTNWPSYNTNTMDLKGNANIIDLWKSYTYDEPIYDFGYAYMQNGRQSDDKRNYVTAPMSAYAHICENSFSQGCKITGAGYDGKEAKGALILYGITDISDAVAAIKKVGGTTGSDFCELDPNKKDSHFVYDITLPKYESLEDLNKLTEVNGKPVKIYAMFFAAGGNGTYNFSSNSVTLNDTDGAYWSSNASKGDAATANAYGLYFRNFKTGLEFCWETDASGVKSSRNTQRSVRLMVEVTDSDSGTTGPEFSN